MRTITITVSPVQLLRFLSIWGGLLVFLYILAMYPEVISDAYTRNNKISSHRTSLGEGRSLKDESTKNERMVRFEKINANKLVQDQNEISTDSENPENEILQTQEQQNQETLRDGMNNTDNDDNNDYDDDKISDNKADVIIEDENGDESEEPGNDASEKDYVEIDSESDDNEIESENDGATENQNINGLGKDIPNDRIEAESGTSHTDTNTEVKGNKSSDEYKTNEEEEDDENEDNENQPDDDIDDERVFQSLKNPDTQPADHDRQRTESDTQTRKVQPVSALVQQKNEAILKQWLSERNKTSREVWEDNLPLHKLDLHPEAVASYKMHNWPWVIIKEGRYDPRLYTPPAGEVPRQRFPDVVIFGAGKCGTRAMIEYLMMHPYIAAARAEVHYFDRNLDKGPEWYKAKMPLSYSNQLTLEKSPSYLWEPRAPRELYRINKDVKLVLLVKDPVVRTMSQAARMDDAEHRHELLFLEEDRLGNLQVKLESHTVAAGLYVEHLRKWLNVFPIKQIHVMEGMELIKSPFREMKKLESFLELPPRLQESNFYFNKTRGFYCPFPFHSRKPQCLSSAKGWPHPKLRPLAKKLIYDFYRPFNERLFKILGRRFDWEPKD